MRARHLAALIAAGMAIPALGAAQTFRTYTVNYTENPPTIDGQRDAGEWDDAEAATGEFRLLRTPSPGTLSGEDVTWQAMWDDTHLYIIVESDFGAWNGTVFTEDDFVPDFSETLELFIDPNRENEPNVTDADANAPDSDSYQIMISMPPDTADVRAAGEAGPPFISTLARYNALFGDNVTSNATPGTDWNPVNIAIARTTTATGAVVEYAIPFAELDAVAGDPPTMIGLRATSGPANGHVWLFNVARISSDTSSELPLWNYHEGAGASAFFAERPHGEITFTGKPGPTEATGWELYQ